MLRRVGEAQNDSAQTLTISQASFPAPFYAGLEYSSPARGTWNIVHTGMLIPESHEIFVCALGCLRGVTLTAAEMNALDRYSAIQIREENVLNGGMEDLMIDGVGDIIRKLPKRPRAILLYISCQHFFLAYDQKLVFDTLRKTYPDIKFMDCYMIPTLRKSGLTPDQKMRMQMFSLWEQRPADKKKINLIGSNLPLCDNSELKDWLNKNGYKLCQLQDCSTFDEYMDMAQAGLNLVYEPIVVPAAEQLEKRLGMLYRYLSFTFQDEELENQYRMLAELLDIPKPDLAKVRTNCAEAWRQTRELIGDTPISLDYTFTFRTLSFAKRLVEEGFNLTEVYIDLFLPEDEACFRWLQEQRPEIRIIPTNQPEMRFACPTEDKPMLALGQKAAYFSGTDHFVNIAESGGYYGYEGMTRIAGLMREAFLEKKDRKSLIQKKGYGCESCL